MITLRRAMERHRDRRRGQDTWLTFGAEGRAGELSRGFGALAAFNEDRFQPCAGAPRREHQDTEIVDYVRECWRPSESAGIWTGRMAGGWLRDAEATAFD